MSTSEDDERGNSVEVESDSHHCAALDIVAQTVKSGDAIVFLDARKIGEEHEAWIMVESTMTMEECQ